MARIVPKCAVCIRFKSILRVISLQWLGVRAARAAGDEYTRAAPNVERRPRA
jgi:hypothetical protein